MSLSQAVIIPSATAFTISTALLSMVFPFIVSLHLVGSFVDQDQNLCEARTQSISYDLHTAIPHSVNEYIAVVVPGQSQCADQCVDKFMFVLCHLNSVVGVSF